VRELVLSAGGDDDMGTLLGMMHSAPPSALQLKAHILKVRIDPKNEICLYILPEVLDVVKFTARNNVFCVVFKLNGRHQLVVFADYVNL
jgi:hypothetical protein